MIKELDFNTFLSVERNKFQIFLFDKNNLKNLYQKELKFQNSLNNIDFVNLSKFLDDNIYKIEKLLGKFIENIYLIIKLDKNIYTNICIKKNFYNNFINHKNLKNILIEAKDLFKENYQDQNIIHMLIDNYLIDGKRYSSFKSDLEGDYLSLEIKFISLQNEFALKFIKIFEEYQIRVIRMICGHYVSNFSSENDIEFSEMAYKIINGYNKNEVLLVPKNDENKGIFEKFFQIFS